MAIQTNLTTSHDITLATAYTKIHMYTGDKTEIHYTYQTFKDQTARNAGKDPISSGRNSMVYTVSMGDMLPAIYTHLKALAEFTGSTDV